MLCVNILLLGTAFVVSINAQKNWSDITQNSSLLRQLNINQCYSNQFQCTNGRCINSRLVCDGYQDCEDGSDESWAICYNAKPQTATTTTTTERYHPLKGGLAGDQTHSTIKSITTKQGVTLSCSIGEFTCTSGECIRQLQVCDGYMNCRDGSDEESSICPTGGTGNNNSGNTNNVKCRSDQFRCNNGQCILKRYQCDGTVHCSDNSDEDWNTCQTHNATPRPIVTQRPQTSSSVSGNTGSSTWTRRLTPCPVPPQPANGHWRLHRSLCDSNRECEAPANIQSMGPGTYLVYRCNEGFNLSSNRDVLCGPGGNWVHQPTCEQIKCNSLSSSTTEAVCLWNNISVSCEVPAPIGTFAQLTCRESFVQEIMYQQTFRNVTCQSDGKWSPNPISCVKKPKKVKLVLEGDMIIEE